MESHRIVSREQWIAARTALLAKEKEFTRARGQNSESFLQRADEVIE